MRLRFHLLALGTCALLAVGCSRTTVVTEIHEDGTWKRSLEFHAAKEQPKGKEQPANMAAGLIPTLDSAFKLPSGPGWKTSRSEKNEEAVYTAERVLKPEEAITSDIALKAVEQGKPIIEVANEASVHQIAPGKWEYRERLHWGGTKPGPQDSFQLSKEDLAQINREVPEAVKKALPSEMQTPENMAFILRAFLREFVHMFFGPPEPMLGLLMTVPDYAAKRMEAHLSTALDRAFEERFGEKMSRAKRHALIRQLFAAVEPTMNKLKDDVKQKSSPEEQMKNDHSKDQGGLVVLTYTVRMPGRIVSSNGVVDDVNNSVTWAFYNVSVAMEDVMLTATCEPEKDAALRYRTYAWAANLKR